jgi:hypothetical protein
MNTTQHTPGPWFAVVTDTTCGGEPAIWEIADRNGGVVAEDISYNPANAHLIAAAPEMLDALEWAVETADSEQYEASWYASARAAIAKAKGGAK